MKISWLKIAVLVLCCAAVVFEVWHFQSRSLTARHTSEPTSTRSHPDFVLLPADEIVTWTKYLAPGSHAESWEPTLGDINGVEADLAQIASMSNPDRRIDNPREYYRQYLAVVVDGKRRIYLNALCSIEGDANWRKRLIVVRDGGKCFWQAMYDPSTHRFSDLTVNGRA